MRIISLLAENVKKVLSVEVTPEAGLIQIAGPNDSGKSSLLDAIEWCLAGDRVIEWKPIRAGQEYALVRLLIGEGKVTEYRVTKTFRMDETGKLVTKLRVEDPAGAPHRKPQDLLNSFLGDLTLDPIAFMQSKPDERIAVLKRLVTGFDFEDTAAKRRRLYDLRTEKARDAKRLDAVYKSMPEAEPVAAVDTKPLMDKLSEAANREREIANEHNRRAEFARQQKENDKEVSDIDRELDRLSRRRFEVMAAIKTLDAEVATFVPLPKPIDVADVRRQIAEAEATNRQAAAFEARAKAVSEAAAAATEVAKLALSIEGLDVSVAHAVATAKLPVRGLALADEDVTLNGVPFGQASTAQQIRASVALAMAENPKLRVIRIRRGGNDLDKAAMEILREVAEADGFDIWIERVEASGPPAIIMEDGKAKEAERG